MPSAPVTPPLNTFRALACCICHRVRAPSMAAPSFEATTKVYVHARTAGWMLVCVYFTGGCREEGGDVPRKPEKAGRKDLGAAGMFVCAKIRTDGWMRCGIEGVFDRCGVGI